MSQEFLPAVPEWMQEQNPPPGSEVHLSQARSVAPGWVTREGLIDAKSGQTFRVTASAEERYERTLECYGEALHLQFEVVPDPPDLAEAIAEVEAVARPDEASVEAAIDAPAEPDSSGARIILETENLSSGNSVTWAAK